MENLAILIQGIAGLGSLVCFIIVIIHFFQSDQSTLGIVCIVGLLACGIGAIIAYVKGWMDGLGTVMIIWSLCIVANLAARLIV